MNIENYPKEYSGILEYPQIVQDWWMNEPNYLIEYDESVQDKSYCAIYFCSNDIWFPHTEEIFRKRIVELNFYEWYKSRIKKAYKHIFLRDVFKQWYLTGINGKICSHERLFEWLKLESEGYKVITIGSSAGGYAAALFGSRLNAEMSICVNAQFSLNNVIASCSKDCNPVIYSMLKLGSYNADVMKYFNEYSPIFYVLSNKSKIDLDQKKYVNTFSNVNVIEFNSRKHGIPFLKVAVSDFINQDIESLKRLTKKINSPLTYTISAVGLYKTIVGLIQQIIAYYKKRK